MSREMNLVDFCRSQTERIIRHDFSALLMNNHKWVKVIQALSDSDLVFDCDVKLVWDKSIRKIKIMHAVYCFDFYDPCLEGMISGYPKGFYDYKEIQWLAFPEKAEVVVNANNLKAGTKFIEQDIQGIYEVISALGQFDLERKPGFLRLNGYK